MIGASERISARFLEWEACGRGFRIWPYPVVLEPPLAAHARRAASTLDDGRRPTFLSSLVRSIAGGPSPQAVEEEPAEESSPPELVRGDLVEIRAYLSESGRFDVDYGRLFASLAICAEPIVFELVATAERIAVQFSVHPKDESLVMRQLVAYLPDAEFTTSAGCLKAAWEGGEDERHAVVVEFGLGREFMVPFVPSRGDPFVGLVGALSEIREGETAVFQVMFAPVDPAWNERIIDSVSHADGSPLFVNAPELRSDAEKKTAQLLFATVVRVAVRSPDNDRSWEIACNVAGALGAYGSPRGNELVPLRNDEYPSEDHVGDVARRQTRRSGMILNAEELAGFVHLPSPEVKLSRLRGAREKTKAAPDVLRNAAGLVLGTNEHAGVSSPVAIGEETRVRHIHIIGATGTGKSTLLLNLIRQDMENGFGCSVLDPHGDLIDRVLGVVPEDRIGDVVLLDPSDEEFAIGFNVLSAHSDWEKSLIASDLVAVFRRLSTAWGDQLNSVLSNTLLAFMESERGGTLFDARRFLIEPKFRAEFLTAVRDPNVLYYWRHAFPALTGNKSVGPVVTRLDTFLSPKPIRYMVAQKANRLDFGDILDSRKIFLAKLPEGLIGKENSYLLGSLLVAKIQSVAMSRQRKTESSRIFHTLYADEFHNFLTPSLAECLSGVRKYRLGLVLVHQEMRQVEPDADVANALLNAGTRIVFRVSDRDARALEGGFSSFEARDLQNLGTGHAVCRVERSGCDFNLAVDLAPYPEEAEERRERVVEASQKRYGTARTEVERAFVVEEPKAAPEKHKTRAEASAVAPAPIVEPPRSSVAQPVAGPPTLPTTPVTSATAAAAAAAIVGPALPGAERKKEEKPAAELGRGGAQHKAVQDRIKEEAEKLGFRVAVEKEVLGGAGQIDLVLSRGDISIACEVTVENTIDYEVRNVGKCIKAGFRSIVVIGVSEEKLAKLSAAVSNSLGPDAAASSSFHLPDAFIAALKKMPEVMPPAPEPARRTRGGRVVTRKVVALTLEEASAREKEALRLMAAMMKNKSK